MHTNMDFEQAFQLADAAVFAKAKRHLKDIEVVILRGSLQGMKYYEIAETQGYTTEYIKCDVAPKLWKLISEALNEKVGKNNFQAALERQWRSQQEKFAQPQEPLVLNSDLEKKDIIFQGHASELNQCVSVQKHQDWGDAPDVSAFFGRTDELATLEQWVLHESEARCRVVAILGMGGIGKTDLSLKLAQGIQDKFEFVIWRALLNAPNLTDLLADLIEFLSNHEKVELPNTVDGRISKILHYLRSSRCLVILDNVEAILQAGNSAGQYREGYEEYGQLLRKIGEVSHQSCLLLTSREKPQEIALLENEQGPVRSLNLSGLNELDSRKIFQTIGFYLGSNDDWRTLIKFYNGNPLALKLVAKHIKEIFLGNISHFLIQGKPIFGNLCDLLDWHFERLGDLEQEVMYWLAIHHQSVLLSELKDNILSPVAKEQLPETLQAIQRRLPLEINATGFTLPPLLIKYITQKLVEQVCEEITTEKPVLLNSHALLISTPKDYVRDNKSRFILKSIQDRLLTTFGNQKNLEFHLNQILIKWQEESRQQAGYVCSNVITLLYQCQLHFSNHNLSLLNIFQAPLQEKNLLDRNFAFSNLAEFVLSHTSDSISSVAFNPDGKLLVAGDTHGMICVWITDRHQVLICQSLYGRTLVMHGKDQTVMIWDFRIGQCLITFSGHNNINKKVP